MKLLLLLLVLEAGRVRSSCLIEDGLFGMEERERDQDVLMKDAKEMPLTNETHPYDADDDFDEPMGNTTGGYLSSSPSTHTRHRQHTKETKKTSLLIILPFNKTTQINNPSLSRT